MFLVWPHRFIGLHDFQIQNDPDPVMKPCQAAAELAEVRKVYLT